MTYRVILALIAALLTSARAIASPTGGPGPYSGTLNAEFIDPSFDMSVTVSISGSPLTITVSLPINLTGTIDVAVQKTSNGGAYTGVNQLEFLGADLDVLNIVSSQQILSGLLSINYTFAGVKANLVSDPLAVSDLDFDGTGTYSLAGTKLTFNEGTLTITPNGAILTIFPPPMAIIDFSATPLEISLTGIGNIVDVPDGPTTVSIPNLEGSSTIPNSLTFTSDGNSVLGFTSLSPTFSVDGSMTATGMVVPEVNPTWLASFAVILLVMWGGKRRIFA